MKEIADLQKEQVYIHSTLAVLGSDEWDFGYVIDYLPEEAYELKRRATSFQRIESFQIHSNNTYTGAWPTVEEALQEAIKYTKETLLPSLRIKVGDKVKIVKYGSLMWIHTEEWARMRKHDPSLPDEPRNLISKGGTFFTIDKAPQLVGTEDMVKEIKPNDGNMRTRYALEKTAWFCREQLQKIT